MEMFKDSVVKEELQKFKQELPTDFIEVSDGFEGADQIPVEFGGRLVPITSINELGKQLLKAAQAGNVDGIRKLLKKGAPFTADWLGTSPLHLAAQHNHLEICEILLRAGISRDARTKVDRTPLHLAVYEGHIDIVECLLKDGADVDCKDLLGMTPLHWAAQNCHEEIAAMLIRHGAQINPVNKFDLTPSDIAEQMKRPDIEEIIRMSVRDPFIAAENLALEMIEMDNSNDSSAGLNEDHSIGDEHLSSIPLETILLEDVDSESSMDPERLHVNQPELEDVTSNCGNQEDSAFCESFRLLQEHGITMLPPDDSNILSSIMENGHHVVLTEVGKQVLNSTKPIEDIMPPKARTKIIQKICPPTKPKKIITITSQEFLAMTANLQRGNVLRQINGKLVTTPICKPPAVKRIVMKKNKVVPMGQNPHLAKVQRIDGVIDVQNLLKQLVDAKKLAEDYKQKFLKKEAEAERYKQQLRIISESVNIKRIVF